MLEVDLLLHPSFRFKGESMKLAARSAGLPGNNLLFDPVPLDPAQRAGLAGTLRSRGSMHFGISFPGCGDVFFLLIGSMFPDCPNDGANGHHARYLGKGTKNGCVDDRSRG
jgi:hypothetical protein